MSEHYSKYGRTYHIPGSPGTTSDDRIAKTVDGILNKRVVGEEKMDGEGSCITKYGLFARSHAAPTRSPWTNDLKIKWDSIKNDIGDLGIYLENMYAIHSIEYSKLPAHYFVFGIKDLEHNMWLSKDEVQFYCELFDFQTTPILLDTVFEKKSDVYKFISATMNEPSTFSDPNIFISPKEGVVIKPYDSYSQSDFETNVLKWVRKGHVKTDEHWTRNWKRASLHHELTKIYHLDHSR